MKAGCHKLTAKKIWVCLHQPEIFTKIDRCRPIMDQTVSLENLNVYIIYSAGS